MAVRAMSDTGACEGQGVGVTDVVRYGADGESDYAEVCFGGGAFEGGDEYDWRYEQGVLCYVEGHLESGGVGVNVTGV